LGTAIANTPLGELTALPRPLSRFQFAAGEDKKIGGKGKGLTLMERRDKQPESGTREQGC